MGTQAWRHHSVDVIRCGDRRERKRLPVVSRHPVSVSGPTWAFAGSWVVVGSWPLSVPTYHKHVARARWCTTCLVVRESPLSVFIVIHEAERKTHSSWQPCPLHRGRRIKSLLGTRPRGESFTFTPLCEGRGSPFYMVPGTLREATSLAGIPRPSVPRWDQGHQLPPRGRSPPPAQ